jgi:hypothetical protein
LGENVGPIYSSIELDSKQRQEIEMIVSPGSFRILAQSEFPSFIPKALGDKCEVVIIAASSGHDKTYIMCDCHRVDAKASCIDREPLLAIITTSGAHSVATFAHHGDWCGRSYNPPEDYWIKVKASGIGACYGSSIPADVRHGALGDLSAGEKSTFEAVIEGIVGRNCEE